MFNNVTVRIITDLVSVNMKQAPMSLGCVPLIILSTFFLTQDAVLYPLCVSPGVKKEIVLFLFEAVDSF